MIIIDTNTPYSIETITGENKAPFLKDSMDGGGDMMVIAKRNVQIPTKRTGILSNYYNNQNRVMVHIFEGEHPQVKDNNYLGSLELAGLRPLPRGGHEIQVSFNIDLNGTVEVSVRDTVHGLSATTMIINDHCLTPSELEQMINDAAQYLGSISISLRIIYVY